MYYIYYSSDDIKYTKTESRPYQKKVLEKFISAPEKIMILSAFFWQEINK